MDTPTAAPPTAQQPPVIPQSQPTSVSGGRVFASPYARTVAAERGVDLTTLQGTGYSGLVTSRDVLKATPTSPSSTTPAPPGGFTDIPLTGMRKVGLLYGCVCVCVPACVGVWVWVCMHV